MVVAEKDCNRAESLRERSLVIDNETNGIQICPMQSKDGDAVVDSGGGNEAVKVVDDSNVNKDDVGSTGCDADNVCDHYNAIDGENIGQAKDRAGEREVGATRDVDERIEGESVHQNGFVEGDGEELNGEELNGEKLNGEKLNGEELNGVETKEETVIYDAEPWDAPVDLESGIVVFVTSCPGNAKVKSDTRRVLHLLNVKKVEYKTVDLANNGALRIHMLERSDLNVTIPQVHVNGVFIGTAEDLQESEDYGELDDLLRGVDAEIVKENTRIKVVERVKELEQKYLPGSIKYESIKNSCVVEKNGLLDGRDDDKPDYCTCIENGIVERKLANHHMYFEEEQTDSIGSAVGKVIKAKKD